MKKNFTIKLIICFTFVFFSGCTVLAASLDINVDKNIFKENESFILTVFLNTEGQSINTIEGDLKYDPKFLQAENVNIGNSLVNFWVEKPDIKTSGTIHFSGITPGGVSIAQGEIFKVIFQTQKNGNTRLLLDNVNLFLNDGQGSTVLAKIKNADITINQGQSASGVIDLISNDKISPEKFNIMRAKDSSIFDNKYFIAFSTVDKGSGVDHYQVCELLKCITAESPFLLMNQTPLFYIVVKAYDMNGNFSSSALISPYLGLLLIIVVVLAFVYIFRRYLPFYKL